MPPDDAFELPREVSRTDNQPADPLQMFLDDLSEDAKPLIARADKLVAFKVRYDAERPELADDDQVGKATELVKEITKLTSSTSGEFETLRKKYKKPLDETGKTISRMVEKWAGPLAQFEGELRSRINRFQTKKLAAEREAKRLAEIEAAKIAAAGTPEAIEKAAETIAAAPVPKAQTRTDYGSMATTRSAWKGEVTDATLVPREFCSPDAAKIAAAVKTGTRTIAGVNIFEDIQTVIR